LYIKLGKAAFVYDIALPCNTFLAFLRAVAPLLFKNAGNTNCCCLIIFSANPLEKSIPSVVCGFCSVVAIEGM